MSYWKKNHNTVVRVQLTGKKTRHTRRVPRCSVQKKKIHDELLIKEQQKKKRGEGERMRQSFSHLLNSSPFSRLRKVLDKVYGELCEPRIHVQQIPSILFKKKKNALYETNEFAYSL